MTELRAKHKISKSAKSEDAKDESLWYGIDGTKGTIENMKELDIWDPVAVKIQTFKSAIESACLLLRIDDVLSGMKKSKKQKEETEEQQEASLDDGGHTFGDERDG